MATLDTQATPLVSPSSSTNGKARPVRRATKLPARPATEASELYHLLKTIQAVRRGNLAVRFRATGNSLVTRIGQALNDIIEMNEDLADELVRVSQIVGQEGRMNERVSVGSVKGAWATSVNSVNALIGDLARPTNEVARVITAVAKGDLSQKMSLEIQGRPVKGEFFRIGRTVNAMVDQLSSFAAEVTRVAKEVGTEGKLGGQAKVKGVSGTWKDLTDNVNQLASNLTTQVRNIAKVTTAVAKGDLSQKITVDVKGEILELKDTINTMVDQLSSFAAEVTRVAKEVGTEGKLGGQAKVPGVSGTWKDLTDNVNVMASNLTIQVRGIIRVVTAVANGELNQKIVLEAKGEVAALADTINSMTDTLRTFAAEVTRVAKEVGTEGKLGGQAKVKGVSGIWNDLTDNVNQLASNLTVQLRDVSKVATAIANGDLSRKITVDVQGEILQIKDVINKMVDQLSSFAAEVTRVAKEVGTEGKLGGQAKVPGVSGTWKDLTDNVNQLASNLTTQVRNIAKVTTAVAKGDLSQKITVNVQGEILELKNTINSMTDTLRTFADQATTVAREVGSEGKLGGQAKVPGVSGIWKDLTDNVNQLASNLTTQVRNIAKVTTAVAKGDLSQKITVDVKGEILELKDTINTMVDQLSSFAAEVTRVAKEVGTEGKLGGQAKVPGVSGTWKDLTDNVNQLASNLTTQVRAIAEVSTAVTKGDLTRHIAVQAEGEVAALKDNINQMIATLKETTQKNQEQDWLKTHLAKFTEMMQGQRSIVSVAQLIMSELTPLVGAYQGTFFIMEDEPEPVLTLVASYAFPENGNSPRHYSVKQGLVGQCAFEKKRILLTDVPDNVAPISSSLVEARPRNVVVLPVLFEGQLKAVIELASFEHFNENSLNFLNQLMDNIGVILNMIFSFVRTEELLQQLKKSNAELEAQAKELNEKAKLLELKKSEVELASRSLEEKAEQLSLISKYKSEFLANMSHELRTPLNSLLLLSKTLANNPDGNLTSEQVQFAKTVYTSGCDLLSLINEILDLAKVEAGKMRIEPGAVRPQDVLEHLEQTFRPVAAMRNLEFVITHDERLPETIITDSNRLQQILKNLLSNAFKFTEQGRVSMGVSLATDKWFNMESLDTGEPLLAFTVQDTGIGIPKEKQRLIFEAFQQADGTTSRKYGGTGLGLTISREIAKLLGGIIEVDSAPGLGSTFTLYLPLRYSNVELEMGALQPAAPTPIPPLPVGADFSGKKILVVDDDRRNIFAITTVLEARGLSVLHAENGRTGVQALKDVPDVDLVLMDVMMPEMDGIEAIQTIRRIPELKDLPIVTLTAKAMKGDREKCLEAGASDYVTKPVDPDDLLALIYAWLNKPKPVTADVVA